MVKDVQLIDLPSLNASEQSASHLASCLRSPLVLTFSGEIGAGKTTFIRAMLRALGVTAAIKSPTFSLVESYQTSRLQVHHFDLYRIQDETELDYIGFRDFFSEEAVCCIEWPERALSHLGVIDLQLTLSVKGVGRVMSVDALSPAGADILSRFVGE